MPRACARGWTSAEQAVRQEQQPEVTQAQNAGLKSCL